MRKLSFLQNGDIGKYNGDSGIRTECINKWFTVIIKDGKPWAEVIGFSTVRMGLADRCLPFVLRNGRFVPWTANYRHEKVQSPR